ncbi:MAG: hypothetical protein ABNG96_02620 [Flavobacterium sp.]|jgi:hypothetical protein
MSFKLNKQKTVLKERLIFKNNWEYIFEIVFEVLLFSIWTTASFLLITNPKNNLSVLTIIVIIFINILLLTSWIYIYKLLKIEISNPEKDRKLLVEILKEKFPDFIINDNGLYILRCKKGVGLFSWGKTLIVIFEENKILINLTTLGRFDTKSPLHSIINFWKLKHIRNEFIRRKNGF